MQKIFRTVIEIPHHVIACSLCGVQTAQPGSTSRVRRALEVASYVCSLCGFLPKMPGKRQSPIYSGLSFWKLRMGGADALRFVQRAVSAGLIESARDVVAVHAPRAPRDIRYVYEHRDYNSPWRVRIDTAGENRRLGPAVPLDGWVLWATLNGLTPYKSNDHCQRLLWKVGVQDWQIVNGSWMHPERWLRHALRHLDQHPLLRPEVAVRERVGRLLMRQAELDRAGSVDWALARRLDVV